MLRTSIRTLKRLSIFLTISLLGFFLVSYFLSSIYAHISLSLYLHLSPPLVRLIRARLSALAHECIQRQLHTPPSSLLYNWMPLLVHVPFPAISSTAPLTAGAQWCVPSWPSFKEFIGIIELGFIYAHFAVICMFCLVNTFTGTFPLD